MLVPLAVTRTEDGDVHIQLAVGESPIVRDSVPLDGLDEANQIPSLDALTLDFDAYGRLVGIRVDGTVDSALAPELLEAARAD